MLYANIHAKKDKYVVFDKIQVMQHRSILKKND